MKKPCLLKSFAALFLMLLATALPSQAQSYAINWRQVAGGGGICTGATYVIYGTMGQHDASAPMTGGGYAMTGGFWSLINVEQSPGMPPLYITPNGPASVKVFWAATGAYALQQVSSLALTNWATTSFSITNGFGTNFCTITSPTGNLFFRLFNP